MIGTQLGRFRIVAQLGAGGMGEVYRAHDEHLHRDVAIKVLPRGSLHDEDTLKRFRREALALSALNHPGIATIHDFDRQGDVDFIVMEIVEGQGLDERIAAGPLKEGEIVRLGIELARGLEAAHSKRLVHRDLKPGNLRLTREGRLKILDFGLSKLAAEGAESAEGTLTVTQGVAGTLAYMAPEQLRGDLPDARVDLWACGAVLYEMATGRRAFPGAGPAQVMYQILNEAPAGVRSINPAISAGLEQVILRALEKDPRRRFSSASALRTALRRLAIRGRATSQSLAAGVTPPRVAPARQALIGAGGLVAVLALAVAFNAGGLRERFAPHGAGIRALAVLPLENLSRDSTQQYFADGMTDELTVDLAQIGALRVISRLSAMRFGGAHPPLRRIAQELRVDAVVTGSVLCVGKTSGYSRSLWTFAPGRPFGPTGSNVRSPTCSSCRERWRVRSPSESRCALPPACESGSSRRPA